jgi:hypothetical protein
MNAHSLRLFLFCSLVAVFSLLSADVRAQTPGEAPKPPKLRFLFIDETAGYYTLKLGADYRQISGNPYEISAPFIPPDLKPLDIYKTLTETDPATGQPVLKRVKIASFVPPAQTTTALVIITPRPPASPDAAPVYQVELIDSDPKAFPLGSIRIINRSPVPMAAQFSESRVVTAPGEISLVTPVTDARRRVLCKIAIQVQQPTGWILIQDSVTVIRPTERMVGVLVYSPGGMRHTFTAAEIAEMGEPKPGCFWLSFSDRP